MKKAKLMLIAISIVAVVGWSISMKVALGVYTYQLTTQNGQKTCTYIGQIIINETGSLFTNVYTTFIHNPPISTTECTLTIRGIVED